MSIKYSWKSEIIPLLLIVASWVLGIYFYRHFPGRIITHWNYLGQPNGYSTKTVGAFLLPTLITILYALFYVLPFLDPKRESYESFSKVYLLFRDMLLGVLLIIFIAASFSNIGYAVNIKIIVLALLGLLFIVLGNYMGKIKPNWFMGIRTPWTLSSENVWHKTHRLGGFVFVISGLLLLITPLLPASWAPLVLIALVLAVVLIPTIYSFLLYQKEHAKEK